MKQRSSKKTKSTEHVQKKKPIFSCELSSEGVKTDCMNHGYRLLKTLGEGAYAKVKLAEVMASRLARNEAMSIKSELSDGELQVAIKVINKTTVPKEFLTKFLPREVQNHVKMPEHPNVVRIYDHFTTNDHVFLVMDYCSKGDLLDLINKHIGTNQRVIGEELSRKIFRQLCEGLQHIHNNGVVHRDLKCENVLLDEHMNAKLTDFGFSASIEDPKTLLKTSCGSYAYTAPEVIKNKPYEGFKSDIWSLGIMLFAMINGRLPFNDTQMMEMDEDMKMQRLRFERSASFDCMVLIRRLLQYYPSDRPSLDEILNDPWITGKKPIPRQIQRSKWINPIQAKKTDEKEVPMIISTPKDVIELSQRARNNTICYRPDSTQKNYTVSGTVMLNHNARETVTLKSRSGNAFQKKIDIETVQSRPNTWPRSEDGSPLPPKFGNKPRSSDKQQKQVVHHKGVDIRNIAKIITERYQQRETSSGSKDISKSVPLWLVNQILNSEGQQSENEKAQLFPNGIESIKSREDSPKRYTPSPNCPACAISCQSHTQRHEKHKMDESQKKFLSQVPNKQTDENKNKIESKCDREKPKSAKPKSAPVKKKEITIYKSPLPTTKSAKSSVGSLTIELRRQMEEMTERASRTKIKYNNLTPASTKVTNRFKFNVMTPASRASMCRERKMYAYSPAFNDLFWTLPSVHGQAVQKDGRDATSSPSLEVKPTTKLDTNRSIVKPDKSKKNIVVYRNVSPKHKVVVHAGS